MGRKKTNVVYQYFLYNSTDNKSICVINECGHEVKGQHGTNLLSHLSSNHPVEFTSVMLRNQKRKSEEVEQLTSSNYRRKRIKQDVLDECVNLVTIHGRPFNLINDTAFQNIINMISPCSTSNFNICAQEVRNAVIIKANSFRKQLREKFSGKLLSLKIDAATCMDRSFLGINVQHVDGTKLVLNTLAVKEVYSRHTAINIKQILKNVLLTYGISINQIYSITTDNGSNMIKLVKLIADDQLEYCNNEGDSDSDSCDLLPTDETNIIDEDEDYTFSVSDDEEVILNSNDKSVNTEKFKFQIRSVRCAAHTLQLAVLDVLKDDQTATIVNEARGVCKKLRAPGVKSILKAMHKKKPIIDCPTRWHSTLDMLERLLELKECCDEGNKDQYLHPQTWIKVEDLVRSLTPARIATKKLQEEQLVIGDFYRTWSQCKLETTKIKTPLACRLVETMIAREKNLFNNDVFLAGMFLDARFNIVLTQQQIIQASNHLIRTWEYKQKIQKEHQTLCNNCVPSASTACENEYEVDEVEKMLRMFDNKKREDNTSVHTLDIMSMLRKFLEYPRFDSKEDILEFWDRNKHNIPELYSLAKIALSVPPTQVSVERLFSSLKYILSYLRYNLSDSILDDMLILRANTKDVNL